MIDIKAEAEKIANQAVWPDPRAGVSSGEIENAIILLCTRYADEAKEEAAKAVEDFDDWVWCTCSDCKQEPHSHAVKTSASMEKLATAIRTTKEEEG